MGTSGLGTLLVEDGLLTEADRRTINRTCGGQGSAFARGVLALGLLDEDELAAFLAEKTRWKVAPKGLFKQSKEEVWGIIDRPLIERLEVLPLYAEGHVLHVAMVDPLDQDTLHQLAFFTGYKIAPVISTLSEIRAGLLKLMANYQPIKSQLEDFLENHASSASRRSRLSAVSISVAKKRPKKLAFSDDDDFGSGESFGMGDSAPSRWTSPVPSPAPPPPVPASRPEPQAAKTGAALATAAAGAGVAATLATGDDLNFHADDDLFKEGGADTPVVDADLGGLDELEEAASAAGAAVSPAADADASLGDLGDDIDSFGLEDAGDDLFAEDQPAAAAPPAPAKPKAKAAPLDFGADDGEDDVDLSAFDPDAEPALDDLDNDFSSISADLAGPPAGHAATAQGEGLDDVFAEASADDVGSDLDGDLSAVFGEASTEGLGAGLEKASAGDLDGELGGGLDKVTTAKLGSDFEMGLDEGPDAVSSGDLGSDFGSDLDNVAASNETEGSLDDALMAVPSGELDDLESGLDDLLGGGLGDGLAAAEVVPKAAPAKSTPATAAPAKAAIATPKPAKSAAAKSVTDDIDVLGDFGDIGDLRDQSLGDQSLGDALTAATAAELDELGALGDLSDAANVAAAGEDGPLSGDFTKLGRNDSAPAILSPVATAAAASGSTGELDDLDDLDDLTAEVAKVKPQPASALELSEDLAGLDAGLSDSALSDDDGFDLGEEDLTLGQDRLTSGGDALTSEGDLTLSGDAFTLDDDFGIEDSAPLAKAPTAASPAPSFTSVKGPGKPAEHTAVLAVDIDVGGDDPLLAPPSAADDAARKASAKRNRDLLRKLAGRKY